MNWTSFATPGAKKLQTMKSGRAVGKPLPSSGTKEAKIIKIKVLKKELTWVNLRENFHRKIPPFSTFLL